MATRNRSFPLGKTGGLIEATEAGGYNQLGGRGFRWVKPAASLKPDKDRAAIFSRLDVSAG